MDIMSHQNNALLPHSHTLARWHSLAGDVDRKLIWICNNHNETSIIHVNRIIWHTTIRHTSRHQLLLINAVIRNKQTVVQRKKTRAWIICIELIWRKWKKSNSTTPIHELQKGWIHCVKTKYLVVYLLAFLVKMEKKPCTTLLKLFRIKSPIFYASIDVVRYDLSMGFGAWVERHACLHIWSVASMKCKALMNLCCERENR